jgi:iron(III) transport system substrate-binding protein
MAIAAPVFAQSGELNVLCTPQELWCQGMEEAFEAKYPEIDVQWIRLSSGEGLARVQSEAGNPTFDIWWGGPMDTFIAAKPLGLLEQYESPNLKNIIPEYYDFLLTKTIITPGSIWVHSVSLPIRIGLPRIRVWKHQLLLKIC